MYVLAGHYNSRGAKDMSILIEAEPSFSFV